MTIITAYRNYLHTLRTRYNMWRNRTDNPRQLEIGPGTARIPNYETLSILPDTHVDYVLDASTPLPFPTDTFDTIYASHVLEHIPWYQSEQTLQEWRRILKPSGTLEIWVPDGLKIAKAFIDAECAHSDEWLNDGWFRFNSEHDCCKWASGRIYTYGDGKGDPYHPNWHRALFSERYLRHLLTTVGFTSIRKLDPSDVRGHNHGWINLGLSGVK